MSPATLDVPRPSTKDQVDQDEAPKFGPWSDGSPMTVDEFLAAEDWEEGHVYELIHGVLVVSPAPSPGELGPNEQLGHRLLSYKEGHPQGAALAETFPEFTVKTSTGLRRADRAIWARGERPLNPDRDVAAVLVEFTSERARDRRRDHETKRDEYLAIGVLEYWVIDRFRRTLTVYRRPDPTATEGFVSLTIKEGETYETPLFPGFVLDLAALLARADQIAAYEKN